MTKLTVPLDFDVFISKVESLERNKRAEYIFENLSKVLGGDYPTLLKYAVENRIFWEKRCCSMLEYRTADELYQIALQGQLPKVEHREKEVILRLARSLHHESRFSDIIDVTGERAVTACYQAEALLKHINNKLELLTVYIHFCYALRRQPYQEETINSINSNALALAQELGVKDEEMQVLINFGRMREDKMDYNGALEYYLRTLSILDTVIAENNEQNDPKTIPGEYLIPKALLLYYIAQCKLYQGDIGDSLAICNQAAEYANRLQRDNIIVYIYRLLAKIYEQLGDHTSALEVLLKAGEVAELLGSQSIVGNNKLLIASSYSKMGEHQKAIEYGLEAISISEFYESVQKHIAISARVGGMMVAAGEFDSAYTLFSNLLSIIEKNESNINLDLHKQTILRHIATISVHRELWEEALNYLQLPLITIESPNYPPKYIIETLVIATDAFIGIQMFEKATNFANRTLKMCIEVQDIHNQFRSHNQLAKIAELQNNYAEAYYHHKEFHRLKEQIYNNESDKRNKNMMIILEQQQAVRLAQEERIRRFELEEEIGLLSSALVHREQALKEIRTTLRTMKSANEHAEQVVEVLQTVIRSSENAATSNSAKTYKVLDEKLEVAFPTLTKIQRELCRFISLGHSTKDIARLMNISVQSVNTQRYRIRNRLELKESELLDSVIKQAIKNLH